MSEYEGTRVWRGEWRHEKWEMRSGGCGVEDEFTANTNGLTFHEQCVVLGDGDFTHLPKVGQRNVL